MVTVRAPGFSRTNCEGVSLPVSLPSIRITPPAGVLETDNRAASSFNSSETEEFAADARLTVRLTVPYPALLAETVCCPGAMPVRVHGLSHKEFPSNEMRAPAGFDETLSCAGTTAGAD